VIYDKMQLADDSSGHEQYRRVIYWLLVDEMKLRTFKSDDRCRKQQNMKLWQTEQ
jgi:hypothetical protein